MTSEIPVTRAREELADLINRVAYGHERIVLTRHSKPVACIVPPEDLAQLEQRDRESTQFFTAGSPAASTPQPASGPMPVAAQHRPSGRLEG